MPGSKVSALISPGSSRRSRRRPLVISSAALNLNLLEPPEDVDAARILDANANRSREALRVLEDHCRFVLNDAFLSAQLKQLRHDLAGLMHQLSRTAPPRIARYAARRRHFAEHRSGT